MVEEMQLDLRDQIIEPKELSKSAFASLIGVTPARVAQLIGKGLPVRADGRIPVQEGREWYATNIRQPLPLSSAIDRSQARAERERYEAELARLKVERQAGRLIDAEEVRQAAFERARAERDAWIGFAARLSAVVAAELGCDQAAAFGLLDREFRDHLARLADTPLEALA